MKAGQWLAQRRQAIC